MPERYLLAADGGHMVLTHRSRGASVCLAVAAIESAASESLLQAVASALEQSEITGGAAEVWLGSAWARLLVVDWPEAPLDRVEREALLEHHWSAVLPEPDGWRLLVAEHGSRRLSVAVPRSLADGLGALLASRRITARSLLPAACGVLQATGFEDGAAILDEGERVTLVQCQDGSVRLASTRRLLAGEDPLPWAVGLAGEGPITRLGLGATPGSPACVGWSALWT